MSTALPVVASEAVPVDPTDPTDPDVDGNADVDSSPLGPDLSSLLPSQVSLSPVPYRKVYEEVFSSTVLF